ELSRSRNRWVTGRRRHQRPARHGLRIGGGLRLIATLTAKRGAGTKWSPPLPWNIDPHSLAKRVAIRSLSCKVQAAKVEVLKADPRMARRSASRSASWWSWPDTARAPAGGGPGE